MIYDHITCSPSGALTVKMSGSKLSYGLSAWGWSGCPSYCSAGSPVLVLTFFLDYPVNSGNALLAFLLNSKWINIIYYCLWRHWVPPPRNRLRNPQSIVWWPSIAWFCCTSESIRCQWSHPEILLFIYRRTHPDLDSYLIDSIQLISLYLLRTYMIILFY